MTERRISDAELYRRIMDSRISEIHTAMPARVDAYDATAQVATVTPQVAIDGEDICQLPNIPVIWPRGGDGYLTMPLVAGDFGLLLFCEADIGAWRSRGERGAPSDLGRHGVHGAVLLPGLYPAGYALPAVAGAAILAGSDVRLGSSSATEAVLHGTAFNTAMNVWLTAHQAWCLAIANAFPVLVGAKDTMNAASTVLKNAIASAVSGKVKVD